MIAKNEDDLANYFRVCQFPGVFIILAYRYYFCPRCNACVQPCVSSWMAILLTEPITGHMFWPIRGIETCLSEGRIVALHSIDNIGRQEASHILLGAQSRPTQSQLPEILLHEGADYDCVEGRRNLFVGSPRNGPDLVCIHSHLTGTRRSSSETGIAAAEATMLLPS